MRALTTVPIVHLWHADDGFRKSIILNEALSKATGDYIIQVDGDVILHKHFVRDHAKFAEEGRYIRGYRIMLDAAQSTRALATKQLDFPIPLSSLVRNRSAFHSDLLTRLYFGDHQEMDTIHQVLGCNTSYWRKDAIVVNGFDEDILGWGGEDTDFAVRLVNSGLVQRRLKFAAIQRHLYHPERSRSVAEVNAMVYKTRRDRGIKTCANGLRKLGEDDA